jgi:hypothetical protein
MAADRTGAHAGTFVVPWYHSTMGRSSDAVAAFCPEPRGQTRGNQTEIVVPVPWVSMENEPPAISARSSIPLMPR